MSLKLHYELIACSFIPDLVLFEIILLSVYVLNSFGALILCALFILNLSTWVLEGSYNWRTFIDSVLLSEYTFSSHVHVLLILWANSTSVQIQVYRNNHQMLFFY